MATYCDSYDVRVELPKVQLSSTSVPTDVTVDAWCTEVGNELDATMRAAGVDLPLSTLAQLDYAKTWALLGVCARVLRATDMESERATELQKLYDARSKLVLENPGVLAPDDAAASVAPTSFDPATRAQDDSRRFKIGEKQW